MDSSTGTRQGTMIGRYHLIQQLGRGGMGEVWLATDTQLQRHVAIKLLPSVMAHNREYLDDFMHEARAAAALEHPHILAVHDFGEYEEDGEVVPYLVMPYVTGGTLRERLHGLNGQIPVYESLRYLRQAARAIDYAHSKQVLHRDIKPANMLLQQGWLMLADFGIAKIQDNATMRGKTHAGSGTPEYMAPEQIEGRAEPASDRYSLAISAYQLFTNQLPFRGDTPYDTIVKQVHEMPPSPRLFNATIPLAIEQVLLRGLAKRPGDRYPSCTAFVDALQQGWMSSAQGSSDPDSTLVAPWSKRAETGLTPPQFKTPAGVLSKTTGDVSEVSTGTPMTPPTPFQPQQLPPVEKQPITEKKLAGRLGRREILIGGVVAGALVLAGGATAATLVANSGPTSPPTKPRPVFGPKKLVPGVPVLALTGHTGSVWMCRWDPTGRYLLTSGEGTSVMIWDIGTALKSKQATQTLSTPLRKFSIAGIDFKDKTDALCWSQDGRKVIAGGTGSTKAYVVDAFSSTSKPIPYQDEDSVKLGTFIYYAGVCTGPTKDLFTLASKNELQIWRYGQTDVPESHFVLEKDYDLLGPMAWSNDGKMLAISFTGFSDTTSLILQPNRKRAKPTIAKLPTRDKRMAFFRLADSLAWSPTDPNLLLVSTADIAVIWDVKKNKPLLLLGAYPDATAPVLDALSWSPNGRYVVGSYGKPGDSKDYTLTAKIHIWDIDTLRKTASSDRVQEPALSFEQQGSLKHSKPIIDHQWSPDGRYIATASMDSTIIIWKVDAG
jgi:serine/threonine protein kinase/WD40 repeat protein